MLISYIDFEVKTDSARIWWRLHRNSDTIEQVEFLFQEVTILEASKHNTRRKLKPLVFSDEFASHSDTFLLLILNKLGLT